MEIGDPTETIEIIPDETELPEPLREPDPVEVPVRRPAKPERVPA